MSEFLTALDPSFRAQELSFAVSQVASNIELTAAAERRGWWERLLGRQPDGRRRARWRRPRSARRRTSSAHSVWLHNSVRGAVGLGLAVLVANRPACSTRSGWCSARCRCCARTR